MVAEHRNRPWQTTACLCACHYSTLDGKHEPGCANVKLVVRSRKRRVR